MIVFSLYGCDTDALSGVQDLDGKYIDPTKDPTARIMVTLFVDSDCPVSNRYAPEVQSLFREYSPRASTSGSFIPIPISA